MYDRTHLVDSVLVEVLSDQRRSEPIEVLRQTPKLARVSVGYFVSFSSLYDALNSLTIHAGWGDDDILPKDRLRRTRQECKAWVVGRGDRSRLKT